MLYCFFAGLSEISRRLMRMDLTEAVSTVRRLGYIPNNVDFGHTVVRQVYHPYIQPDGTSFAGRALSLNYIS